MFLPVLFGLGTVALGYLSYITNEQAKAKHKWYENTVNWPSVTGKVIDIEVKEVRTTTKTTSHSEPIKNFPIVHTVEEKDSVYYVPKVRYQYSNPGSRDFMLYSSEINAFKSEPHFSDKFDAQNYLDNLGLAKEKNIKVFYNPNKINNVTLLVGDGPDFISEDGVNAFCVIMTVVSAIGFLFSVFNWA